MDRNEHKELVARAKSYLAANAAESGADVLINDLVAALECFQPIGWAEPGEQPTEIHEDLGEFVLDHHSDAGSQVLEVMPIWASTPQWAVTYCVGDESDQWEEVDLYPTQAAADAAHAKNEAAIANTEPV